MVCDLTFGVYAFSRPSVRLFDSDSDDGDSLSLQLRPDESGHRTLRIVPISLFLLPR